MKVKKEQDESKFIVYNSKIKKNYITIYNAGKFGEESLVLNRLQAALLLIDLHKFLKI